MRAASVMWFVVLGAVGFAVGGVFSMLLPVTLPFSILAGGAVGGASLGLASRDWKRVALLALLGALGLTVGVLTALVIGSFFSYPQVPIAAFTGTMVGASLGAAFLDWRTILALAFAGAAGFGVGLSAGDLLQASFPMIREAGSITVAGLVGGASLGAALGYLELRKLVAAERGSRLR
jgi:hypothetical protein